MSETINFNNDYIAKSYMKRYKVGYTKIHHFRLLALCVLSFDYIIFFIAYQNLSLLYILKYLTEWSYLSTFIYFLLSCMRKADRSVTTTHSGILHTCLSAEFLVVLFYWVVIYPNAEFENFYDVYLGYSRHILPFLFLVIDYSLNNIKLSFDTLRYGVVFLSFYLLNNLIFKIIFDIVIYKVITWDGELIRCSELYFQRSCGWLVSYRLGFVFEA